jgi:hypothetical protein
MGVSYSYVRGVATCGSAINGEGSCAVGMREGVERLLTRRRHSSRGISLAMLVRGRCGYLSTELGSLNLLV